MGFTQAILKQARKPSGHFGRLFVRSMNTGHGPVTKWGLGQVDIRPNATILDIGCGGGRTVNRLAGIATEGQVYGLDYSEVCVAVATAVNRKYIEAGRVKIWQASVDSLPFPADMFDLVTAIETCYFWPDLVKNLSEIRRVLKPAGRLIIINEAYRDESFQKRNSKWVAAGGFNCYSADEFSSFLKEAGYARIMIDTLPAKNWLAATGFKDNY